MKNENSLSLRERVASKYYAAAGAGSAALFGAVPAFASVDTTAIEGEITSAKTAGMAVLGAMILAGLAFKAWKLLKRA